MPTTPGGLPYPASTDPPNVPADIQALAQAVETQRERVASGTVSWPSTATGATSAVAVSFPAGRFTLPPAVTVSPVTAVPKNGAAGVGTPSATAVTLYWSNNVAATGCPGRWIASQDRAQLSILTAEHQAGDTFGTFLCGTAGCGNKGIAVEMQTGYTDDDGADQVIGAHQCGVCGAEMQPA
jgi:hypothetical protein